MRSKDYIVFKDHLIPNFFKGMIFTSEKYFILKNKTTAPLAKQFMYHMDLLQKKKLAKQFKKFKDQQKFQTIKQAEKYAGPLKQCPSYFQMIIEQFKKEQQFELIPNHKQNSQNYESNEQAKNFASSQLLLKNYNFHPARKAKVYSQFKKAYYSHKMENTQLRELIGQSQIYYIPPLLYTKPIQIFRKQNPDLSVQICRKIFESNKKLEWEYIRKMTDYIKDHKNSIQYISVKAKISTNNIMLLFKSQMQIQRYLNFYL